MRVHREQNLDYVAGFPGLTRRNIARRIGLFRDGIAVHDYLEIAFFYPVRVAHHKIEEARTCHSKLRRFSLRESRFLPNFHLLVFPVKKRCGKKVHIKVIAILRINKLRIFRRVFHSGTHAAPHSRIHLGIHPIMAGTRRSEVHVPAMSRMYCR